MSYFFSKTLDVGFDEAIRRATEALKAQGFGVLTEIDVAATLKTKIGVDFRPYRILGACNPPLAHRALQAEESIGLLLPCNVVVRSAGPHRTVVEALDPQIMFGGTYDARLGAGSTPARWARSSTGSSAPRASSPASCA